MNGTFPVHSSIMQDRLTGSRKRNVHARVPRLASGLAAFCTVFILGGCGGSDAEPTLTAPPISTATTLANTPTPLPAPSVGDVVWTASVEPDTNAPGEAVEKFNSNDPGIYAVVRVSNLPAGAVLSASWSYNGVPLDGVTSGVLAPSALFDGFVEFHISKSDDVEWPDGTYVINVLLNGDVKQVSQIEVVAP